MIDLRTIESWLRRTGELIAYQYRARHDLARALKTEPEFVWAYYQWLFLIYWSRGPSAPEFVRLGDLHHAHPIEWESYFAKLRARVDRLQQLDVGDTIDMATLNEVMPSSTNMIVGHDPVTGLYIVMEGNGRLQALREAFPGQLDLKIEVEVFQLTPRNMRVLERLSKHVRHSPSNKRLARVHGGLDPDRTTEQAPAHGSFDVHHVSDLLGDPGFRADPYPLCRELRESAPVLELRQGAWVLSSHEAVSTVLGDDRFSSDLSHARARPPDPSDAVFDLMAEWVLLVDPPEHTQLRHIVNQGFRARDVQAHRDDIHRLVAELLAEPTERGRMDFVADFAYRLPISVICELFGLPPSDRDRMHGWANEVSAMMDPTLAFDPERREQANAAVADYLAYIDPLVAARRAEPGSDVLSFLATCERGGYRLTDSQVAANAMAVLLAGHETITATLAHSIVAFHEHPDQWERLAEDPTLLPSAALECMRYACPFTLLWRAATEDVDALGHKFAAGDVIALLLPAANRDPAVFENPDTFDVARNPTEHLAQGAGTHLCLGVHLAPAELEIALGALTQRLRDVRIVGDPADLPRSPSMALRSYTSMPITFERR